MSDPVFDVPREVELTTAARTGSFALLRRRDFRTLYMAVSVSELGDALKVSLTSPPVEGRANEACIEFFANLLDVPRASVTIASGETSRRKVIRVTGLSGKDVRRRLGL